MTPIQDALWSTFAALWADIRTLTPQIVLTGGYALFLKQSWLLKSESIATVVNVRDWRDQTPRSTRDLDFIAEVGLIASTEQQHLLDAILNKHKFKVVAQNARWQFAKPLDSGQAIIIDFHAPSPAHTRADVRVESRRVKPLPSLQHTGIHGRENREAIGVEFHPFEFQYQGLDVLIPNPVTFAIMKLTAMRDKWVNTENTLSRGEGEKHAEDVCRVIAMMTREEYDLAPAVIAAIHDQVSFNEAKTIFDEYFSTDEGRAMSILTRTWRIEHLQGIRKALATWFANR